jgi:uncharacterized membrane protein
VNDPVEGGPNRGIELDRVAFFSDGVFAIAITLLVLEIRLPEPIPGSHPDLSGALLAELWPDFYSFLISFWFVGTLWIAHHRVFHYIRGYDRSLLLLNLFFLMWIVVLPFSSTLLSRYEDQQMAVIIYAAHVAVAELALAWVWRYASRTPPLDGCATRGRAPTHIQRASGSGPTARFRALDRSFLYQCLGCRVVLVARVPGAAGSAQDHTLQRGLRPLMSRGGEQLVAQFSSILSPNFRAKWVGLYPSSRHEDAGDLS